MNKNKQKTSHSLFQSGSTMGIQILLVTGSSTPKLALRGEFYPMSSWTDWRGSSLLRTWRSGQSMRLEFRPSMVSALDLGANLSMEGPGSLVRREICIYVSTKITQVCLKCSEFIPLCLAAVPSSGPTNVSAFATTSSSILVRWGEVPEADRNGLILGYKVTPQLVPFGNGNAHV